MASREHDRIAKLSAGNFDFSDEEEEDSDYEQEQYSTKDTTTPSSNSSDRSPPGYTKPIAKPGKRQGKLLSQFMVDCRWRCMIIPFHGLGM